MAAAELTFGRQVAPVFRHIVPIVVTLFPAAACLAIAAAARTAVAWLALAAVLVLVTTQLPELGGAHWSWRSLAASLAAALSAAALVHANCQRHV
jgi:hypothetical protein